MQNTVDPLSALNTLGNQYEYTQTQSDEGAKWINNISGTGIKK